MPAGLPVPAQALRPAGRIAALAAALAALAAPIVVNAALAAPAPPATPALALHRFLAVSLSPDGRRLASIERAAADGAPTTLGLVDPATGARREVALACGAAAGCRPSAPTWLGGGGLAFLLARPDGTSSIEEIADPDRPVDRTLLVFKGPLDGLAAGGGPDGPRTRLAVLATAHAHKLVGATAAGRPLEGEIGTDIDEQRIAVVEAGGLRFVSPPDLYVYEFAWLPDGSGFVGTAAEGDGDSNWWVARLDRFALAGGPARTLLVPDRREQLADPVVSPDGRAVAFVGGWMSDFGSTGGDAWMLDLDHPTAAPRDLTAGRALSVTSLDWTPGGLLATALAGERVTVTRLAPNPAGLWAGSGTLGAGGWNDGVSCAAARCAAIAQDFTHPPEIVVADRARDGTISAWHAITRANAGASLAATARSLTWSDDGRTVQGWLLVPDGPTRTRSLVVDVHGGPEAAAEPEFPGDDLTRAFLAEGRAVIMPNYRGSYGQGEAFAQGSIHDVGGGDWRDVLASVDAAERATPIDDRRLAIMGGSYGGYMAMQAVASTHRFAAAMADAGVSDWLSIEGEAPEQGADATNFGGLVYDDPAPYLKASPVMHIAHAATPSLVVVGDRDVECPMPQSEEFATALRTLHVPVSFVVYAGEGHGFTDPADRADVRRRTLAWFDRYLGRD